MIHWGIDVTHKVASGDPITLASRGRLQRHPRVWSIPVVTHPTSLSLRVLRYHGLLNDHLSGVLDKFRAIALNS